MAWLEQRGKTFHVAFRYGGQKFKKSLKAKRKRDAEEIVARVDRKLRLLEYGDLTLPDDADLTTFVISDGRVQKKAPSRKRYTLDELFRQYLTSLPHGAMEENSLKTIGIHLNHFRRVLSSKFPICRITLADLQRYVTARSQDVGRHGKLLSPVTIKKELASLSGVWTWAIHSGIVDGPLPSKGLRFPKTTDKPPFQPWSEIERQISRGHLSEIEHEELWDCLLLSVEEVNQVLSFAQQHGTRPFIYPMLAMAAHTGARRSEILRCQCEDFNFEGNTVLIREKKRSKDRRTFRSVPLSPYLSQLMKRWLAGQNSLLAYTYNEQPISSADVWYFFRSTFAGNRWEKIRGWHVFRHSFISNCAAKGIDQRMIDSWSGHQTEEMRRRYTHLFPDAQQSAIQSVFEG